VGDGIDRKREVPGGEVLKADHVGDVLAAHDGVVEMIHVRSQLVDALGLVATTNFACRTAFVRRGRRVVTWMKMVLGRSTLVARLQAQTLRHCTCRPTCRSAVPRGVDRLVEKVDDRG
jgi:hypothetical protein